MCEPRWESLYKFFLLPFKKVIILKNVSMTSTSFVRYICENIDNDFQFCGKYKMFLMIGMFGWVEFGIANIIQFICNCNKDFQLWSVNVCWREWICTFLSYAIYRKWLKLSVYYRCNKLMLVGWLIYGNKKKVKMWM